MTPASHRIPGVLLALAGGAVGLEAMTFNVAFMTDPVGPKALPLVVAVTLIVAGLHAAARPPEAASWPDRPTRSRMVSAVGAFLAYAVALPFIGFFTSTTLVVSVLSHLYGAAPRKGVPAAAALAGVLWLLFVQVLGLPLPIGDLWMR